jgi:hypothetical protein
MGRLTGHGLMHEGTPHNPDGSRMYLGWTHSRGLGHGGGGLPDLLAAQRGEPVSTNDSPATVSPRTAEEWAAYAAQQAARYPINRDRLPVGAIRHVANKVGRNEYTASMDPALLDTFTDDDLIDLADGGPGSHFGGHVTRHPHGQADITVWIN